ncbi:hypothetical protein [Ruficoccus sp. ZRK36]|uniref:alpha/beta hydrolase family protein n=1 Tax=Ruficoccus sp. ZRK36 TaxID=2866311 RepID=UPI001C72FE02|nr:hypothetical protein [Ruficoccus sp. ZRK36]QYY35983.1 hypothetical protein K0V07_00575 [Ruficoccus sp. ZRK36]
MREFFQSRGAECSEWEGFEQWKLECGGIPCRFVLPRELAAGHPWVWKPEFFEAFPNTQLALLERGWVLAFLELPDHYGCPRAVAAFDRMHTMATTDLGLSPRMGILAMSRAGLSAYNYTSAHPEKVFALYADNPVCDFRTWPGGMGAGPGGPGDWAKLLAVYGLTDAEARNYARQPLSKDVLAPIVQAGIPVLHVCGDSDETVPYEENTCVLRETFKALGGNYREITIPGGKHHPHGLPDPAPIVAFYEEAFAATGYASAR